MATAPSTKQLYIPQDFSIRKLWEIIDNHNLGVQNDHTVVAALDGDSGVTDTDYEAALTAKEIPYEGYTPTEAAVPAPVPQWNAGGNIPEALVRALLEQHNARVTDIRAAAAKLNADGGVTDTNYTSTAKKVCALGITPIAGEINLIQQAAGDAASGRMLQHLEEQLDTLTQDWHTLAAKLDADGTVNLTTYEAQLTAKTLTSYA